MAFDQNKPVQSGSLVSADIRNNFQHIKSSILKEHNWNDSNADAATHKLDAINITVTGSTQTNISTGGQLVAVSGAGHNTLNALNQVAGLGAGTYSIQKLLQELVNRSHSHGVSILSSNCDCNCDCNCSSCFIAGTMVLMSDWTWKPIEQIKAGEKVIGIDGKVNTVITPYFSVLGNQRNVVKFCDNSLFWSAEHMLWVKSPSGLEYWGTHDFNQYRREKEKGTYEFEGRVYNYAGLTKKEPLVITSDFSYGHLSGWLKKHVVIDRSFEEETLVYSLATDGSHTYIVNGYFATGFADDTDFDYLNSNFIIGKL